MYSFRVWFGWMFVACGTPAEVPAPPAEPTPAAPPVVAVSEDVFACTCALHTADVDAGASGQCKLTVRSDGTASFEGEGTDLASAKVAVSGQWTVVPVPENRVEPEPFPAFRGPLTVGAHTQEVDVTFVDNLMYEAHLALEPAQSLSVVCSPPDAP